MADQAALEQKYASVGAELTGFADVGAKMEGIFMEGDKLALKGSVPSKVVLNRIWDIVKRVDPAYADFDLQMAQTGPDAQPYTIKSGDTLSAVCLRFYGHANLYPKVAEANHADANNIPVGTTLQLPVLS